jgi:hypothetical protein
MLLLHFFEVYIARDRMGSAYQNVLLAVTITGEIFYTIVILPPSITQMMQSHCAQWSRGVKNLRKKIEKYSCVISYVL